MPIENINLIDVAKASDLSTHEARVDNPHSVTKTQVGLSNVDNTSDANKPISTAAQEALDLKQDRANYLQLAVVNTFRNMYNY
jgi:hypothetical protein